MAQLGGAYEAGEYGPHGPWWQMHRGHTRSWPHKDNDWTRMELPSSRPSPRHRRWGEIQRPAYSAYSAAPSSVATSRQRPAVTRAASVLLSSPSGMRHRSSDSPLLGRPPAVPSLPRASTAPTGKAAAFQYYNPRSPSGSRRAASHREPSPRSAHYYRSTPDSRRSMRSSMSESDNETDLTRPTPDDDDDDEDETLGSIFVDKQTLRERLDIRRRPSQEYPPSSRQKQKQKQNKKQKEKQRQHGQHGNDRDLDQDLDQEEEVEPEQGQEHEQEREQEQERESSILQQQDYQQPQRRSHHRHRSRRSSGSRGGGGGSSSRGRKRESVIPEEDTEEQRVDADTEMDNEDEEDRRRRRTPSRHTRRSISRHTAATQDRRRDLSRSKSRLRRADSDEFNPRASSRRPTRRYCESEVPDPYAGGPATLRRAQTQPTAPSHVTAPPSIDSSKRPSSLFESPLGFASHAFPAEKSSKRSSCLACMEEFPSSRVAKLKCGHRMCSACLKKKFKSSMSSPRQMPPRCCTVEAIAPKHVEKLFDSNFKQAWNYRFREISTANRIYCPSPRCGEWIKPENMFREEGREIALCGRCRTKVCCLCNGRAHASPKCQHDEQTMRFLDDIKAEGRQRCYKCKSGVELQEGRNHMVCRCGAESCMICGTKWGHCDCPVFDCDATDTGHVDYEHLQYPPSGIRHDRFGSAPLPTPRDYDYRASNKGGRPYSAGDPARSRPQSYEEKSRLRPRMEDYRADDLARRMEAFRGLEDEDDEDDDLMADAYEPTAYRERFDRDADVGRYPRRHADDDLGIRPRRRRSFVDDDYEERAATDILPSVPQPPPAPPTPPQQQAQPMHRYQHHPQPQQHHQQPQQHQQHPQQHQQHPQHQQHQAHQQHQQHQPQEQHQRQAQHSHYPSASYDRPTAAGDYYTNGVNRARGVHADSQVGRLADRFNTDSRSSPMHRPNAPPGLPGPSMAANMPLGVGGGPGGVGGMPMGPLSPVGPMPLMPPMVSMSAPPPPPPAMAGMPMMPMAPIPPPGLMAEMPIMRRHGHAMDDDPFASPELQGMGWPAEQVPFSDLGRPAHYDDGEGDVYGSGGSGGRRHRRRDEASSQHPQQARMSEMAGLAGIGRGMDRVPEWVVYVGGEPPEMDTSSSLES